MSEPAVKANFLDRAIQVVAPSYALERYRSRALINYFGYDAANPGRLRGGSGGMHKNASAESPRASSDAVKLMWDARDMYRNDSLIGGLVDRVAMYVCAKIAYQPRTGDPEIDRAYRDYFYDWCTRSDFSGRHRLREQMELAFKGMVVDGDHGLVKVRQGMEIRLQHVEADRIGSPLEMVGQTSEKYIRGITINDFGQIVSYRVFKRTRTSQYVFDREVPANQFIHLRRTASSDQYRPVSALARVLPHARDLHELIGFAKQQQKFASMFSGFFKPKDPFKTGGGDFWDTPPKSGEPGVVNAQAGMIKAIPSEYGDISFAPECHTPTGAFMSLFETVIRLLAHGTVLPYGFVWDMAVFGGVTARIELVQVDRAFARHRQLLVDQALEGIKNDVLGLAIAARLLPPHPNWKAGKWNFGGRMTGDYGHDTTANLQKLQAGLVTATSLADEEGEEYEEIMETAAKEMQFKQSLAASTKIPIELFDQRFPNATQLLAAINTPPAPPPAPPPGLLGEIGDKGVKQVLEVLKQVGEGVTDRESGIEALVQLTGIERHEAEKMVPDGPGPSSLGMRPEEKNGRFGRFGRKLALNGRR